MNAPGDYDVALALPTTRQDQSALAAADIDHLTIYAATGDAAPVALGTIPPTTSPLVFVDKAVAAGSYGFQVTATDKYGQESEKSDVFPLVVSALPAPPAAPTITGVTAAS